MKAWLLDEGTPGHTVQTAGLGGILERSAGWETVWIPCRLRLSGWKRPWARLLTSHASKGRALALAEKLYPGLMLPDAKDVGLVISSCGKSAYLNRLLAVETGARNVFVGERKPFPSDWFDLIATPVSEGLENELTMPVIETGKSPESGKAAMTAYWPEGAPEGCWTILIGGSSRTHRYAAEDWSALARGINELARRHGIRWLLSTSRRTGVEAERQLAREIDGGAIAEAVWYGREPKKSVGAFLAAADRIFVTQDSLTMMSEGLAMDKRVELLVPRRWKLPESGFSGRYVRRLIAEGNVGRTSMENLATHRPEGDGKAPVSATRERWAESFVAWASGKGGLP
jgi:uncharacterized protein